MIEIREVKTRRDLKKFVEFPNKLYKGNKYYCPPVAFDELNNFIPKKNPVYRFCESREYLAYKDNKLVGRIAGIINYKACDKFGKKQIRFARFDAIDDIEVTRALFGAVRDYGIEKGMCEMIGPMGFLDIDREGMLIEGFSEMNMSITYYNYPYYKKHMEEMGFAKDVDWVEYKITVPEELDKRIVRVSERVLKSNHFQIKKCKSNKELTLYARDALNVFNKAYAKLYGFVALDSMMIEKCLADYIPILNKDYCCLVVDKYDEIAGFGFLIPSIAKACQKHNGHMFPFGWMSFMKALKGKHNPILEMFMIAVRSEYRNYGIPAIIISEIYKACKKNGVKYCETGAELEKNTNIQALWKNFDIRQHRKRRSWIININDIK